MIRVLKLENNIEYLNNKFDKYLNNFLSKISSKKLSINISKLPNVILGIFINYPGKFLYCFQKLILKLPLQSLGKIYKIYKGNDKYFTYFQDSVIDGIERRTGDVRESTEVKSFLNKYFIEFLFRSLYIIILIEIIDTYVDLEGINCIYFEQFDGYPFGAISTFCKKKKMYMSTGSLQVKPYDNYSENINILVSKSIVSDRIILPKDLIGIKNLSNSYLDDCINLIKKDFALKRDPVCNPEYIKYDPKYIRKNASFYINKLNNKKKTGLVLIHLLTDLARKRNENIWFNNYLEWLNETIKFCSENKSLNWIFKAHPMEPTYPILKKHSVRIINQINQHGFTYIEAKEKFLHEDVSKIASVIVTCHGTCKIEYPALYKLPVISCIGYNSYLITHLSCLLQPIANLNIET